MLLLQVVRNIYKIVHFIIISLLESRFSSSRNSFCISFFPFSTDTCPADIGGDMFPCFVIDGAITVFSTDQLDSTQRFQVENGIRTTVQSGKLVISDPRFLAISFDDFVAPPPTEAPTPENESWWSTFLAWINDTAWWILLLIVLGIVLVLVVLPVALCCICKRRRLRQQQEQDGTKDNDVEQVIPIQHVPMEDDEVSLESTT